MNLDKPAGVGNIHFYHAMDCIASARASQPLSTENPAHHWDWLDGVARLFFDAHLSPSEAILFVAPSLLIDGLFHPN